MARKGSAVQKVKGEAIHPVSRQENLERDYRFQTEAELHEARDIKRTREVYSGFYGGVDPRRRQEYADAGLIREDRNAMANLPRMAQHHEFIQDSFYQTPYLDDTEGY